RAIRVGGSSPLEVFSAAIRPAHRPSVVAFGDCGRSFVLRFGGVLLELSLRIRGKGEYVDTGDQCVVVEVPEWALVPGREDSARLQGHRLGLVTAAGFENGHVVTRTIGTAAGISVE